MCSTLCARHAHQESSDRSLRTFHSFQFWSSSFRSVHFLTCVSPREMCHLPSLIATKALVFSRSVFHAHWRTKDEFRKVRRPQQARKPLVACGHCGRAWRGGARCWRAWPAYGTWPATTPHYLFIITWFLFLSFLSLFSLSLSSLSLSLSLCFWV